MSLPFEDVLKEFTAEYQQARDELARIQQSVAEASGKARSKNRMLTVVCDGHGELTELKFHTQGWRNMAPGELSKLIVQTAKEARRDAQQQMWSAMGQHAPGVDLSELAAGRGDWSTAFAESLELPQIIKDFLAEAVEPDSDPRNTP